MQPTHLLKNLNELPAQVRKVLTVKYAAKPFAQLSEIEQEAHSIALLLKINVVTGWPVPDSNEAQNILAEQLKLYLVENWPLYNVEEIMYAMRSYATVIENWGKNMNLSLIGKAMSDYEDEREDISKLEESKSREPQTNNLIEMQADWKELCELYYQDYLKGEFKINIMPYQLYDEFVRCEMMAPDTYEDWVDLAIERLAKKLDEMKAAAITEVEKREYEETVKKVEAGQHNYKVEQLAKKLSVELLYYKAKKKGFKQLFQKQ